MWKFIAAALNRFVSEAYESADTAKKPASLSPASAPVAPGNRESLETHFQQAVQLVQAANFPTAVDVMRVAVEEAAAASPNGPLYAEARF